MEECFAAQDSRFVAALRDISSSRFLESFVERWKKDPRPWARERIFEYLDQPLNSRGHHPLVKRLFKFAEEKKDVELTGAFLTAFDATVRRVRRTRSRWDRETRSVIVEEYLSPPKDVILAENRRSVNRRTGQRIPHRLPSLAAGHLFTYRTRYYLRRRAWRFFRWLGYARPASYPAAVASALRRYKDDQLLKGENILDSWGLLNICFRGSNILTFSVSRVTLAEGAALAELKASPRFPNAWKTAEAASVLFELITTARSHLVRMWAMELFGQNPEAGTLEFTPAQFLALLNHEDEQVQQFGAVLFSKQAGLEKLSIPSWLELLQTKDLTALSAICDAFEKHVIPQRLSLEECIDLACQKPVPIARLGFRFVQSRQISRDQLPLLARLAEARASAVAGEIAAWALPKLAVIYDRDQVSRFFDSVVRETRLAAWAWLVAEDDSGVCFSPGYNDPVLWSRITETPFDELKLKLVDHLSLRSKRLSSDRFAPVWTSVLLGVHRGGRQKLKAVRQLAACICEEPHRSVQLLPVLSVAVRSIRGPEMRAGLSAVMTLLSERPEFAPELRALLPELLFDQNAA